LLFILANFALCPRVPLYPLSETKKSLISHFAYPVIIVHKQLNTSIRSDLHVFFCILIIIIHLLRHWAASHAYTKA